MIRPPNQMLEVGGKCFEVVNNFVYLGSLVNSNNDIGDEIRRTESHFATGVSTVS